MGGVAGFMWMGFFEAYERVTHVFIERFPKSVSGCAAPPPEFSDSSGGSVAGVAAVSGSLVIDDEDAAIFRFLLRKEKHEKDNRSFGVSGDWSGHRV